MKDGGRSHNRMVSKFWHYTYKRIHGSSRVNTR